MKRTLIAGGVFAALFGLLAFAVSRQAPERSVDRAAATLPPSASASSPSRTPALAGEEGSRGFLYGRITTEGGATYEGRLRWGKSEEAFWGDHFNGRRGENPWIVHLPPERLTERRPIKIFGLEVARRERPIDFGRPFMARFGDIARIEAHGRDVQLTLKSGTLVHLDRFEAGDFDDDVRVWDAKGVVDLESRQIRAIEFLPSAGLADPPSRLYGTVRTPQGDFTGFVQWNREESVGSDELAGRASDGKVRLRFDAIRSIARRSTDRSLVTLRDGREIVLSGAHEVGDGNRRGIYVDDLRYGRVLVSWEAFERLDLREESRSDSGPAYGDFPPGRPLAGSITTRAGRHLTGRLVYDLDESETTETLDAPAEGVDYFIPFGRIAAIRFSGEDTQGAARSGVTVTLDQGEELVLERSGDLGAGNGGLLIFVDGGDRPEHVPWADIVRVDFDRLPAIVPPLGGS